MAPSEFTVTPDDVHAAKDTIIHMLTAALVRAQAENIALRRALEGDDATSPPSS